MDDDEIPSIHDASTGEICSVVLVIAALLLGFTSMGTSFGNPAVGYAASAIAAGLSAIALAILSAGRKMSRENQ